MLQAEGVWAAHALVFFENLGEDLQGGLDTVQSLEAELHLVLLEVSGGGVLMLFQVYFA